MLEQFVAYNSRVMRGRLLRMSDNQSPPYRDRKWGPREELSDVSPWCTEEFSMKGSIGHQCSLHAGRTAYLANPALIMQWNYEQTCPIRRGFWRTSALSVSPSVAVSEPHLLLMQQSRKKQSKHPGCS